MPMRPSLHARANLAWALTLLGALLTLQGYRSLEGDQAYRLPLLLHRQSPRLYAADPFVTAIDQFNPHRGFLTLLDLVSRPLGLPAGLFALYVLTFALTYLGISRLARAVWPQAQPGIGPLAVTLVLIAQAGNIGTNHLFGPMLLDRLLALSLGWTALAALVASPGPLAIVKSAALLGLAGWIHPSLGLQLVLLSGAGWLAWSLDSSSLGPAPLWRKLAALPALALAALPSLHIAARQPGTLFDGMPLDEFRTWSAYVQSPQHLVPSLWRMPQWLAWFAYPLLAALSLLAPRLAPPGPIRPSATDNEPSPTRRRLVLLLAVNLLALLAAWVAVEPLADFRVTLFQPFRLATVARGLSLVLIAGRVLSLWSRDHLPARLRAALLVVSLTGDWSLVVVALVELAATVAEVAHFGHLAGPLAALVLGLGFLARHDTASGHVALLATLAILIVARAIRTLKPHSSNNLTSKPVRLVTTLCAVWTVPLAAALAPVMVDRPGPAGDLARQFVSHCRFGETPRTDEERLALWARRHTPADARFVTPPGPKSFRLWSRRAVAFNRAGSPYHAAGLADWAERFRQHVRFAGSSAEFARAYLSNRQRLEARFDDLTGDELAALAVSQGARYVLSKTKPFPGPGHGPLEALATEGPYTLYRVAEPPAVQTATATPRSAGTG